LDPQAVLHWSGGKDAALCLYRLKKSKQPAITNLLTTVTLPQKRITMHGVRETLLDQQAKSLGFGLLKIYLDQNPSMEVFEKKILEMLTELGKQGTKVSVFGDIFLEDLKRYRETLLKRKNLTPFFPLWGQSTQSLANEFIDLGFEAIVVSVDDKKLGKEFIGRKFDRDFLASLPKSVDPCGENGEFHTFVYDGPMFHSKVNFSLGEIVLKVYEVKNADEISSRFWFCDLIPE
jgi:uncharacterized protein (TIGR00290 family)